MEKAASRSATVLLLVVIVGTIVHQCSSQSDESDDVSNRADSSMVTDRSTLLENGFRAKVTRSNRKMSDPSHLNFGVIDVEGDESVLFQISGLGLYDGIFLHLHAVLDIDQEGVENLTLAPKLFDSREAPNKVTSLEGMPEGDEHQRFLEESDRQVFFRKLSQTKGIDIMTGYSQGIEEGATVEIVCCPGKDQLLMIDVRAQRGRDGRLRLRFGQPYLRARAEAQEFLEAIDGLFDESK